MTNSPGTRPAASAQPPGGRSGVRPPPPRHDGRLRRAGRLAKLAKRRLLVAAPPHSGNSPSTSSCTSTTQNAAAACRSGRPSVKQRWTDYSESWCARWLLLPEDDAELRHLLERLLPSTWSERSDARIWCVRLQDVSVGSGDAILELPEAVLKQPGCHEGMAGLDRAGDRRNCRPAVVIEAGTELREFVAGQARA